ncbi:nuclear transport factor 2 family protein [Alteromonas australica]|uniref:nuclear transport factor 2 family protein n=1 Tax=Alteromonas australica TaxID=589873 RepID=UPI0035C7C58C
MKNHIKVTTLAGLFLFASASGFAADSQVQITGEEAIAQVNQSNQTLETAKAFLWAAGSGDMKTLDALMTEDFVWANEGDGRIPWIGTWEGKDVVMNEFLPAFGGGLKTTHWSTDFSFASGSDAVFMGTMSADVLKTGKNTGQFNWAVRVHVENGKVKRWTWLENSFAVSQAYAK